MVFFLAIALLMPLEQQRYSAHPSSSGGKVRAGGSHVKNATDFTFDGEFLKQTVADNLFLTALEKWTKDHGAAADVRHAASEMLAEDVRVGEELRKLAARKHVTLTEPRNAADAAVLAEIERLNGSEMDGFFREQTLMRSQLEIARFQTEAQQGNDPDIKKWAAGHIEAFDRHVETLRVLKPPRREP